MVAERKLIGKGAFTKAYQIGENLVEVFTSCPAKECYSMFSQENSFAPKIERNWDREEVSYLMPLYSKMRAPSRQLNKRSLVVYKELRRIEYCRDYHDFCGKVNESEVLTETEKEEIVDLAGDVCNAIDCMDLGFEISPRNVSCDERGNLVMMDCFFCRKTLRKIRS